jgi:hypothetical protein
LWVRSAFAVIVLMRARIGGVAALLRRLWGPDTGIRGDAP